MLFRSDSNTALTGNDLRSGCANRAGRAGDQNDLVLETRHSEPRSVVLVAVMMMAMMIVTMVVAVIVTTTARVAVLMIMCMSMVMIVGMIVVMVIVPVMVMGMVVTVVVRLGLIGAAFGLERRFDRNYPGAERRQQFLDRRIASEPQALLQNLHRDMPVAEMPGEPRQRRKIGGAGFDQRLGLGDDLDQRAVIEHHRVVRAQPHGLRKVEFHTGAFDAEQEALLRPPLRMAQDQRVDDVSALPSGSGLDACGAWHGRSAVRFGAGSA